MRRKHSQLRPQFICSLGDPNSANWKLHVNDTVLDEGRQLPDVPAPYPVRQYPETPRLRHGTLIQDDGDGAVRIRSHKRSAHRSTKS